MKNTFSLSEAENKNYLPKRIILVRHGESEGNANEEVLEHVPNYKIKLNEKGSRQAQKTGSIIRDLVSKNGENWKAFFYVSPSKRTRETMEKIINRGETFGKDRVTGVREECRLREQHFGNFQEPEKRRMIKRTRCDYGKFFYRVPDGESSVDVFDRVSSFIEMLCRDMEMNKFKNEPCDELNLIIVSHGLTILLFLMKWFNWTVDEFECLTNPQNCEYRVLELGCNNEDYSLAIHHSIEEQKEWGFSDEMIEDQNVLAGCHKSMSRYQQQSDVGKRLDDNVE